MEALAISVRVAKSLALTCAILLVGSGITKVLAVPPILRNPFFALALVAAGMAILFARSWGYLILYLVTFASLMPPQRHSLLPVSDAVWVFLRLYAGISRGLSVVLVNLLFAGLLAWTHLVLYRAGRLDYRLPPQSRQRLIRAGLLISIAAIVLPLFEFILALIVDPPGPGGPAAPGGGMKAFAVLVVRWPVVLAGWIGVIALGCFLMRSRRNKIDA